MVALKILMLASSYTCASAGSRGLTPSDFDSAIDGKDAFVKFQAPW